MKLPLIVAEWVAFYEKEYGKRPSEKALRIVTYFERLGMALKNLGDEDARKGRKPLPLSVFYDLTRPVIVGRKEIAREYVQVCAELMQDNYMTGYNGQEGGKA